MQEEWEAEVRQEGVEVIIPPEVEVIVEVVVDVDQFGLIIF